MSHARRQRIPVIRAATWFAGQSFHALPSPTLTAIASARSGSWPEDERTQRLPVPAETLRDVVAGVDADYGDERHAGEWIDVGGES